MMDRGQRERVKKREEQRQRETQTQRPGCHVVLAGGDQDAGTWLMLVKGSVGSPKGEVRTDLGRVFTRILVLTCKAGVSAAVFRLEPDAKAVEVRCEQYSGSQRARSVPNT